MNDNNIALVIDSSDTFINALSKYIFQYGSVKLLNAKSCDEAKIFLQSESENLFCVILDLGVVESDPIGAITFIRDNYPHLALIIFTNGASDGVMEDALELDIADYMIRKDQHNVEYTANLIHRIYRNPSVKVLVVDDSRMARAEMERLLSIHHYHVIRAASGEEALVMLEHEKDIKLILLDCYMGGVDGVETCHLIRQKFPKEKLSIIGVSGKSSSNMSASFIKSGANDFLVKPFLKEEFYCRVNHNVDHLETISLLEKAIEQKNFAIGTAAHDIRGPIGVIKNIGDCLLLEKDPENIKKYIKLVIDTSNNTLEMLDSLLSISVIETGEIAIDKQSHSLYDLVAERINFYDHAAQRKGISLKFEGSRLEEIPFDNSRITQVIDNFLSNAIKYATMNKPVTVSVSETKDHQMVEVKDTGPGIAQDNLPKMFSPFQKFGNATAGERSTGLGLFICKNFIDVHKGEIGHHNNEFGGSTFFFRIPK